ncbi:MAG: T9SS type A sorting domain-containing protein, partial [Ignavibacteria bacterium]|nr:T9SS type A sorting domain-containing protein [Ignavibacteria bacterium]
PIGIQVGNAGTVTQSGINIYNNTIMLSGSTLNWTSALSMGIRIGAGATVVDVRNNLVVNNLGLLAATGLGAVGLHVRTSSTQLSACDNNCYYINPTAGAKNFGRISTTGQTTLAGWRTATGKETVSFSSNPVFVSGTDYHITAADLSVSGRGTYIASVTDDYDGNPRATSQSSSLRPVDVGADQYTPAGYSGNVLTPAVSGIGVYYDGDLRAVEIESLTGTIGGIKQYPGVQTPNNVLRPIDRNNNTQEKINSKPLNKDGKLNNKKKDGTSGGNTSGEAVNTPWIYWKLTGMTDGTYGTFRFYYNEDQLAGITESVLRLSYWDPNANTWENSFSQSVNVSGNYIQVTFPTGMDWDNTEAIFAVEDPATPLPVVLESFDVSVRNRDAGLNWVTSYELNNKGFGIERKVKSEGGYTAWKEIGFVNGNGTSNKGFAYSYTDRKLNKGSYQYRLRQVDYNGNAEYFSPSNTSDIVVGNPNVFDLGQNYPNPSNPKSKIDFQMPFDGKVSIKVYDLLGREVATLVDGIKTADFYTVEFDGSNLASGTYFYRIIAESGTEKFTKTLKIVLVK